MIGGIVIEVANIKDRPNVLFIDCVDTCYPKQTCAIMVENTKVSRKIDIGDGIWWQGRSAFWTPQKNSKRKNKKQGVDFDIEITRVGYSGITHPARRGFKSKEV